MTSKSKPATFKNLIQLMKDYPSMSLGKVSEDLNKQGFSIIEANGSNPAIKMTANK